MTIENESIPREYVEATLGGTISEEELSKIAELTQTRNDCVLLARTYAGTAFERLLKEAQGAKDIGMIERQMVRWKGLEIELNDNPNAFTTEQLWEWAINQASIDITRGIE